MKLLSLATILTAGVAVAAPKVDNISFSWNAESLRGTVTYDLRDEPAVVTMEILVNGQPVDLGRFGRWYGDVDRLVAAGDGHVITCVAGSGVEASVPKTDVTVRLTAWAKDSPPDYMVVDLSAKTAPRYYASADLVPGGITNNLHYKTDKMVLRRIHAAGVKWRMGSNSDDNYRETDCRENPHLVTLSNDYYIGVFELTQQQYLIVTGNGSTHQEDWRNAPLYPAERLNHNKLRGTGKLWPGDKHEVDDGSAIDLFRKVTGVPSMDIPTAAQWEYACRAGTPTRYYWGMSKDDIGDYEWVAETTPNVDPLPTSGQKKILMPVGLKKPNPWGLYDMLGNVREQVLDWFSIPDGSEEFEPTGPNEPYNGNRAVKGGGTERYDYESRSGFVTHQSPKGDGWIGARLSCAAVAY